MADVVNTNGPATGSSAEPDDLGDGGAVEEPVSLKRLLATYTAWSSADVTDTARRRAHAGGDVDRAAALEAMTRDAPSPTQALAAAHELTSLLAGWRWHAVRAAREAGATWHDIAAATGTDPVTAHADYAARVEQAGEQATAAGFEFRDEQRYRAAARSDPHDPYDANLTDGDTTMDHDDQPQGDEQHAESRWPVPKPTSLLEEISDRELIARAEFDHTAATSATGDTAVAWTDLKATRLEAERRAVDQPPDSVPAQVAGYSSLVSEDHTGALAAEATSWRADLDQVLPPAGTDTGRRASWSPGENAARVDARMSAQTPDGDGDGAGFNLSRLDEVTERWGYAVFDPAAPGGVREATSSEYAELLAQLTPTPRVQDDANRAGASAVGELEQRRADTAEAQVDEVERRTADPAFAYDPTAEWGDATYREPRTQEEADTRTAHVDAQRALHPSAPRPPMRALTEVEGALGDAELDAELSARAHDLDPEPSAQVAGLEALQQLRPVPALEPDRDTPREAGTARHQGPEVEFEDQLFRRSLEHSVPEGAAGREQAIERAVEVARDRFWTHGLTTYPDEALALASGSTDDDPARLRDLLEQTRAQLAARDATTNQNTQDVQADQRREQLTRWHDDDRDTQADDSVANAAGQDPLLMRCFGDPPAEDLP